LIIGIIGHATILWLQANGWQISAIIFTHSLVAVLILISLEKKYRHELIKRIRIKI
jgi:hypothetical protein